MARGEVIYLDSFGNVVTNIPQTLIDGEMGVRVGETLHLSLGGRRPVSILFLKAYSDAPPGSLLALIGSGGLLEVSVNKGSGTKRTGASVGVGVSVARGRFKA